MKEIIETGKISSRGQVAIPADIRAEMDLQEGTKILFIFENDSLLIKKVTSQTFAEITRPFKEAAQKAGLKEEEVLDIISKVRAQKHAY